MVDQRLTKSDVEGIYCIMPTPAVEDAEDPTVDFTVDLDETVRGANALVEDGVDAIMINGTYGEAATLSQEEWEEFTRTVVETVDGRIPAIAGPTTTGTKTTIERAKFASDVGADGIILGRPMWSKLSADSIISFYNEVANEVPELGIVVYENSGAFKGNIGPDVWDELIKIPNMVAAKYSGGLGAYYREVFNRISDDVRFMTVDRDWYIASIWYPDEAKACWSPAASCDPYPATILRDAVLSQDHETARWLTREIVKSYVDFYPDGNYDAFRMYNIPIEKYRFNAAGYIDSGPPRPPYNHLPDEYRRGAELTGERWAELSERLQMMDEIPPAVTA